jgi:hypothetical protein
VINVETTQGKTIMAKVVTGKVRVSFWKADKGEINQLNGKHEFSTQIIIQKSDTATVGAIKAAAKSALTEKFGDKIPPKARNPLRDGDTELKQDGSPMGPAYAGCYFMNVKGKDRPGIISFDRRELADGAIKSGDYVRVSLNSFAYSQAGNTGVSFGLNNVMFMEAGESLGGGRTSAYDDFGLEKPTLETAATDSDWA